jgi:hypothetical protein
MQVVQVVHDFRPELTNLMRSGQIYFESLQMRDFHFMGCQLSPYGVKVSLYGCTHNNRVPGSGEPLAATAC